MLTKRLFDTSAVMARDMLVIQPHDVLSEVMQSSLTDEVLLQALAEDGTTAKKRARHEASVARLVEAQQKLKRF